LILFIFFPNQKVIRKNKHFIIEFLLKVDLYSD